MTEEGEHESDGSYKRANHVDEEWDHRPTITGKTKQDKMMLSIINIPQPNQECQSKLWHKQQQREDERKMREIAREDERHKEEDRREEDRRMAVQNAKGT